MELGIQEYQFERRFGDGLIPKVRAVPTKDMSVEWALGEELMDKWIWLVTDCYEELGEIKGIEI